VSKIQTLILLSLLSTVLAGCAGQDRIDPPDWNQVEISTTQITEPENLPLLCEIITIEDAQGIKHGTWSAMCWKALQEYEIKAEGNTEIAKANADALRKVEGASRALLNAGKMERELSDFYLQLYEEEKSGRFIDSLLYRSLISLGILAVML